MRVLVFHGYLLHGTGSNVYNANLAAALARGGHEVHLLCQERAPLELGWVDAAGDWESGELELHVRGERPRVTVYRPDIGGLLPVYVADRYEGVTAKLFAELSEAELDSYLRANVAAVAEVAARVRPDVALANHLVMGPLVLARSLPGLGVPYAVKVHGSALEYTVKRHPRFMPHAREGLAAARAVLVGSRHTAESLWAAMEDPELPARTRLGPPGVDVHAFGPREPAAARAGLQELVARLRSAPAGPADDASSFARAPARSAQALAAIEPGADRLCVFVGKLIASKGVELLLAAWPLVLARVPRARLVIVGFGAFEGALGALAAALAAGEQAEARAIAAAGRGAEGGEPEELPALAAFLDAGGAGRPEYRRAAAGLLERVAWAGRLDHDELAELLPAAEAIVVPSTFPEAFGMVAAEGAACGALPVVAGHSGLAEVARALGAAVPPAARGWLSFELGPGAVEALADRLVAWLQAPDDLRAQTRRALVGEVRERYSWEGVARSVLAAAQGRVGELPCP